MMGFFNRPTTFQFYGDDHKILLYGLNSIARYKLTEIFIAENALRELTQREETLQNRTLALQKAMAIESDGAQLEKANQQLEMTQAQYPRKEYALYRAESMLPPKFKKAYDDETHHSRLNWTKITTKEDAVTAAARNPSNGDKEQLFSRTGHLVSMSRRMSSKAAAGNDKSGGNIMATLLDERGADIPITDRKPRWRMRTVGIGSRHFSFAIEPMSRSQRMWWNQCMNTILSVACSLERHVDSMYEKLLKPMHVARFAFGFLEYLLDSALVPMPDEGRRLLDATLLMLEEIEDIEPELSEHEAT
ncbi:hypothetical protein PITC_062960 [Penicillium italicum]|uniref:Uncharacterized protein n=1 Tax=Penicillium italicum TaxID=40296 RepID=A0A0A2L3M6_PENIT|nr:hypothetical protein PITC_062960 [Penicillium italicum]